MGNKKILSCPFLSTDGWIRHDEKVQVRKTGDPQKDFEVVTAVNREDGEYHYQTEDGAYVGYWKSYIYTATNKNAEQCALRLGAFYKSR